MGYRYDFPRPAVTVDAAVFSVRAGQLQVLLIRRADPPEQGRWALPGGFVEVRDDGDQGEGLEDAAFRELEEETGLRRGDVRLEQLRAFGEPGRDPRGRIITVAYLGVAGPDAAVESGSDAADAGWFPLDRLPPTAFDHAEILAEALARLRRDLDRLAPGLAAAAATREDLQRVHDAVRRACR